MDDPYGLSADFDLFGLPTLNLSFNFAIASATSRAAQASTKNSNMRHHSSN